MHFHPHWPGRNSGRKCLLGALLPRACHSGNKSFTLPLLDTNIQILNHSLSLRISHSIYHNCSSFHHQISEMQSVMISPEKYDDKKVRSHVIKPDNEPSISSLNFYSFLLNSLPSLKKSFKLIPRC